MATYGDGGLERQNQFTEEIRKFLEEAGLKELHGQNFGNFVETEFHRLNHDGDEHISFDEFKTCFTRFQRLRKKVSLGTTIMNNKKSEGDDEIDDMLVRIY